MNNLKELEEYEKVRFSTELTDLKTKQIQFLSIIFSSNSITQACEKIGISRNSFYLWLREDSAFRKEYENQIKNLTNLISERIKLLMQKAIDEIEKALNDEDKKISYKAAKDILDYNLKIRYIDSISKLEQLEREIKEYD